MNHILIVHVFDTKQSLASDMTGILFSVPSQLDDSIKQFSSSDASL
jgi:hypothetical protein